MMKVTKMKEEGEEMQQKTGYDVSSEMFCWTALHHRLHTTGRPELISAWSLCTIPGADQHLVADAVVVLLASSTSSSLPFGSLGSDHVVFRSFIRFPEVCLRLG